jgi:leucyl-tRNA synthetase
MLFKAPPDAVLEWDSNSINGVHRWLHRVWTTVHQAYIIQTKAAHASNSNSSTGSHNVGGSGSGSIADNVESDQRVKHAMHSAIESVSAAFGEKHSFNTVGHSHMCVCVC